MKTPEKLWPALRQYRHNNSDGLVMGFDCEDTIKEFKLMQAEIDKFKKENKRILDAAISERMPMYRKEKE